MRGTLVQTRYFEYDPEPLIKARQARSLSQRQAAEEAKLNYVTLCRIEVGSTITTYEYIQALCDFYKVEVSEVISAEPIPNKSSYRAKRLAKMLAQRVDIVSLT